MSDTQWPRYQVFEQLAADQPHQNAGSVHAPDDEMALQMARDVFVRRPPCMDLWVARQSAIFGRTAEQLADPAWRAGAPAPGEPQAFAVFCKTRQAGTHTYLGQVQAAGPAEALERALAELAPPDALVWWVLPERAIRHSDPADAESLFAPARDKTYRDQSEYRSVALMYEIKQAQAKENQP